MKQSIFSHVNPLINSVILIHSAVSPPVVIIVFAHHMFRSVRPSQLFKILENHENNDRYWSELWVWPRGSFLNNVIFSFSRSNIPSLSLPLLFVVVVHYHGLLAPEFRGNFMTCVLASLIKSLTLNFSQQNTDGGPWKRQRCWCW